VTIESTLVGKAVVVKLIGTMDAEENKKFDAVWDGLLEKGSKSFVLDLSELDYINSAGLVSFVRNGKHALEKGGTIHICGIKGLVKELFEMTQLIKVFPVFDSTEAACRGLA
jgi:anti-sigma B factor antagonist